MHLSSQQCLIQSIAELKLRQLSILSPVILIFLFVSSKYTKSTCFPKRQPQHRYIFLLHIIAYGSPTHNLLPPPLAVFSASPGDDRRAPAPALEAGGGGAGS